MDELAAEDSEVAEYVASLEQMQDATRAARRPAATRSRPSSSATCGRRQG